MVISGDCAQVETQLTSESPLLPFSFLPLLTPVLLVPVTLGLCLIHCEPYCPPHALEATWLSPEAQLLPRICIRQRSIRTTPNASEMLMYNQTPGVLLSADPASGGWTKPKMVCFMLRVSVLPAGLSIALSEASL